ncbi:hypothetical protein RUND412_009570 [Rhizina undulata]
MAGKPASAPTSLSKQDRTIIVARDGAPVPLTVTPLTIHNAINKALDKPLIGKVCFTPSYNVQLVAITTTFLDTILKFCLKLEEAIHLTIPSSTSIQKDT